MKKIAIILAIIMILTTCLTIVGCGEDNTTPSDKEVIMSKLKSELSAKIALYNVINGTNIFYSNNTANLTEIGENTYKVSGTVTAISAGTKYTANYSGEVEYAPATSDCDFDIEIGQFR